MGKILYTVARDDSGQLIKAVDAEKNSKYFCPICNSNLLLRKSGNTGKNSKRAHFAHKTLTPNCTPETALHFSFKNLLYKKIQDNIQTRTAMKFDWNCSHCDESHSGDLLKKATDVRLEYNMTLCQPDIALLDKNGKVFAVIEIVVTHKPEKSVLDYFKANNIILIEIHLTTDDDVFAIEEKIKKPSLVQLCINPRCTACNEFMQKRLLTLIDGHCWKCFSEMKIATIQHGKTSPYIDASDFSEEEVKIVNEKGGLLKLQYSKTQERSYIANTCPSCDAFAGEFFLFQEFYMPASYGELKSETIEIGYVCEKCWTGNPINAEDEGINDDLDFDLPLPDAQA